MTGATVVEEEDAGADEDEESFLSDFSRDLATVWLLSRCIAGYVCQPATERCGTKLVDERPGSSVLVTWCEAGIRCPHIAWSRETRVFLGTG
jgi:hypothetical protein